MSSARSRSTKNPFALAFFFLTGVALCQPADADTFTVDKNYWGTPTDTGTFSWAVNQANNTVGLDTISILPSLSINVDNPGSPPIWLTQFTDSVVVEGNGATLVANPTYVTSGGLIATKTNIIGSAYRPPIRDSDIVVVPGVSFAEIGAFGQDNTGISVEFRNLNGDGLGSISTVNDNAMLSVNGGNFSNIVNYTGSNGRSAFEARSGSILNLNGISLSRNYPFGEVIAVQPQNEIFNGSIAGSNSTLNMQNSYISSSFGAGAIFWNGGTANIVSSIVSSSGGLQVFGDDDGNTEGVLNFVNSLLLIDDGETLKSTSRINPVANGEVNVVASSILYNSLYTTGSSLFDDTGMPLTASLGGTLNLKSSAVVVLNWDEFYSGKESYVELDGGNLTADEFSFITPTTTQDRNALLNLFNNSEILTEGTPLALDNFSGIDLFQTLPFGATPLPAGPLVGVVPNAGSGGINELINPIDGQPILTDVFGNPRVNAAGFRDIGAVQVPEPSTIPAAFVSLTLLGLAKFRKRNAQLTNHDS